MSGTEAKLQKYIANREREEQNKRIVKEFMVMGFEEGKVKEAFAKYVGPNYKQHNPTVADGYDAAVSMLSDLIANTPGIKFNFARIIAEGDIVAIHYHFSNQADPVGAAVVDLFRLEDKKIVEHWDVFQPVPQAPANSNSMF